MDKFLFIVGKIRGRFLFPITYSRASMHTDLEGVPIYANRN